MSETSVGLRKSYKTFLMTTRQKEYTETNMETIIVLNKEDFTTLINGGVVEKDGAKVILQDIGFTTMDALVRSAALEVPYRGVRKLENK